MSATFVNTVNSTIVKVGDSVTYTSAVYAPGTHLCASQILSDTATINWDTSLGQVATVTVAGNRTIATPTNLLAGAYYAIEIIQDTTGSRTAAWSSAFKWAKNSAPTLSTTANSRDFFTFKSDGISLFEQGRSQGVI